MLTMYLVCKHSNGIRAGNKSKFKCKKCEKLQDFEKKTHAHAYLQTSIKSPVKFSKYKVDIIDPE